MDKILHLPKRTFKKVTLHENGSLGIVLNLKNGWGEIISIMVGAACNLAGLQELEGKIQDILFAKEPSYKIVRKDELLFTEAEIMSIYLEFKEVPFHNLNPPAHRLMEALGIEVPEETKS